MSKETAVVSAKTFGTQVATLGAIGYAPVAPGTWGSVAGLVYGAFVQWVGWQVPVGWQHPTRAALIFLALWVAFVSIRHTEDLWQTHDDGRIVIDELAAQALVVVALPWGLVQLIFGFAAFRLFDIWKPGIIGWCDEHIPGSFGTLMDDVAAAIAAILSYGVVHYACVSVGITI